MFLFEERKIKDILYEHNQIKTQIVIVKENETNHDNIM